MKKFFPFLGLLLPAPVGAQSFGATASTAAQALTISLAAVGTHANRITTTTFVHKNNSATGPDVSNSMVTSPGMQPRSLSSRAADIYNVRDYGALGMNNAATLATQFSNSDTASLAAFAAQSVNGTTPYAWMTNPVFGLTFSISTSTDQGGVGKILTFLASVTGINNWAASVAAWQVPGNGNYLVKTGMQVSGSCIAAGTIVTTIGSTPGSTSYGTVTLSQATSADCASGTAITFTIAPSQLQLLTVDWLGIQSAMAAGWQNSQVGGSVYVPAGNYIVNHALINGGGISNTGMQVPNLEVKGDGVAVTRLQWPIDLGRDNCAILSGGRGVNLTSNSAYHDFRLMGPGVTRVNGTAPNAMDGLCIGAADRVYAIRADSMRAGINGLKDHWSLHDVNLTNNGYGVYFAPYSSTIGNQLIEDSGLAGNTIASVGVSTTNQIDSSVIKNVHTGFSPFGFFYEPSPATVARRLSTILSNTLLVNVYVEGVGNGWIYGTGESGAVISNTFIGGGYTDVGSQKGYALSSSAGNALPAPAVIYVNEFQSNTMIGTFWAAYNSVTDDIVETSDYAAGNTWINDSGFVYNATSTVAPIKGANNTSQNRFLTSRGDGIFRFAGSTTSPGVAVYDNGYMSIYPYQNGRPFSGITASPAGAGHTVGIIGYSAILTNVVKADRNQAIAAGQPVFAALGGVSGGIDQEGAIGEAIGPAPSGSATVNLTLDPGVKGGSTSSVVGLTAAGINQATALAIPASANQFASVAMGSGTILRIVPIGKAITIYNDGGNALLVYPPIGGQIGTAATNAGVRIAAGNSATFRRISTTLWHQ